MRIATMAPIDGGAPAATPSPTVAPTPASASPVQAHIATPIAQPAPAHPAISAATMPGGPVDGGATIQTRLPTMGGTQSIALPMSGPSRRTMIVAGAAIAVAGIALGALVAMRALKGNAPTPPTPTTPENNVALVETPHVIGQGDADVSGDASAANEQRGGHATGGSHAHASNGSGTAANNTTAGGTTPSGTTSASAAAGGGGTRTTSSGTSSGSHATSGSGGTGASTGSGSSGGSTAGSNGESGGGNAPTPGDLAQLNGGGSTTGGGIAPRGPSVGGYVQGEETDATGTMDPTVFSYVYRHYRNQISACQSMVTRNAGITGTMRIRVRLGVDGHVVRTRVISNTTNNTELATCVQNSVRSWAYPRPEGGEVEFDYNFGFGS